MLDFKRNINRVYKNREPFWGKYVELNSVEVPSLDAIQQYQLSKIQILMLYLNQAQLIRFHLNIVKMKIKLWIKLLLN